MPDYPSNISRAQFALIQPDLENFHKHTSRYYDMWRDKPDPTADSLLERLLKKLSLPIALHRADRPERRL
ncbi:hypothetical protein FAM6410_00642 [Lacticaseibacillus paracasei]|nr:hypothetical protein FAM6410_00642 [Lacticaseibacillus paracasei]